MEELLGLCSGRFSDSEDSRVAKNVETQDNTKGPQKGLTFNTQSKQFDMNELLGLCSGKFTDGENDDDVSRNLENDSEKSECELSEEEDKTVKSDDNDDDEEENRKPVEKIDREEGSDPEGMIIQRKYGKKYEAKKRCVAELLQLDDVYYKGIHCQVSIDNLD